MAAPRRSARYIKLNTRPESPARQRLKQRRSRRKAEPKADEGSKANPDATKQSDDKVS